MTPDELKTLVRRYGTGPALQTALLVRAAEHHEAEAARYRAELPEGGARPRRRSAAPEEAQDRPPAEGHAERHEAAARDLRALVG